MSRILRLGPAALLLAFPVLVLARPASIYHHSASLAAHSGGTVRLILSSHDVVIHIKPGDSVVVTTDIWAAADSEKEKSRVIARYAPKTSANGNDIVVRAPEHHGWNVNFGWGDSPQARVTVVMPPNMAVNYHLGSGDFRFDNAVAATSIKGKSGSGDVSVHSASKKLQLRTGSGDMEVKLAGGSDAVALHTGSGDIEFTGATGSLKLEAGSGDITADGVVAKSASLGTGSGNIVAHWEKPAAGTSYEVNAGSGDVRMYFPAGTAIGGRISTGSGDVTTQFPATIQGDHDSYTLAGGAGAVHVDLNSGSGDVELRKGD